MRTTLTIDDDVLAAAKGLAARQNKTIGEVISALSRNGVPLLNVRPGAMPVTPEMVSELRDELP
jgi:hypothetical protein